MKVKSVEESECSFVSVDEDEFLRTSEDSWYVKLDGSFQPIHYCEDLEKVYQTFVSENDSGLLECPNCGSACEFLEETGPQVSAIYCTVCLEEQKQTTR